MRSRPILPAAARSVVAALTTGLSFGLGALAASAQDVPESVYDFQAGLRTLRTDLDRDQNGVSASRRKAPVDAPFVVEIPSLYEPLGVRLGSFVLRPVVDTGLLYNGDVNVNEGGDALAVTTAARFQITSLNPRERLQAQFGVASSAYIDRPRENVGQVYGGLGYRRPLSSTVALSTTVTGGRFSEDRGTAFAPVASREPIVFDRIVGRAALLVTSGRLVIEPFVEVDRAAFHDGSTRTGSAVLIQRDRSLVRLSGGGSAGFAFSPDTVAYVGVELNRRDYDVVRLLDRDSSGVSAYAGVRLQPSALIRLDVALGYVRQSYRAPLADPDALFARLTLDWSPARETVFRVRAEREISESGALLLGGVIRTRLTAEAEHELRRNFRMSGSVLVENNDVQTGAADNRRYRAAGEVRYLVSRGLEIVGRAELLVSRPENATVLPAFERPIISVGARRRL